MHSVGLNSVALVYSTQLHVKPHTHTRARIRIFIAAIISLHQISLVHFSLALPNQTINEHIDVHAY